MGNLSNQYFSRLRELIENTRKMLSDIPPEQATPILAEIRRMEDILSQYDKAPDQ